MAVRQQRLAIVNRRQLSPADTRRKAPHVSEAIKYYDGATVDLRNRVAYGICGAVYSGRCACAELKREPCSAMVGAASTAIMIADEDRPL